MSKNANGRSTIYKGKNGTWRGAVSMGFDPATGEPVRKSVRGQTKKAVAEKVKKLEEQRDTGVLVTGPDTTLDAWLSSWVTARATAKVVRPSTVSGYKADLKHITRSGVGRVKLRQLRPEHIEQIYAHILGRKRKAGTVAHVRRTLSAALNTAAQRGYLPRNPVKLAQMPKQEVPEINPYNADEIAAILAASAGRRNGVRWSLALLGMRQGEVLALTWDCIDLDAGTITVKRTLTRPPWNHGCLNADGGETCGRAAGYCPQRYGGEWQLTEPKSRSGRRTISLPDPAARQLREHRRAQAAERLSSGSVWNMGRGHEFVVAGRRGQPYDKSCDTREWQEVVKAAGVRKLRIHDLRHSAATYALVMGVDSRTLLGTMGWSSMALVQRYTHLVPELRKQVADVQARMWKDAR